MSVESGAASERRAEDFLRAAGYRILERNYRGARGEVDLIARDGDTLVFVEVKARSSSRFGLPEEAVGSEKRRKLIQAASLYLQKKAWEGPARFDVVAILGKDLNHIQGAFEAS